MSEELAIAVYPLWRCLENLSPIDRQYAFAQLRKWISEIERTNGTPPDQAGSSLAKT